MQKLYLIDGNKTKEYLLELSFNSIVDTDIMSELADATTIVNKIDNYNKAVAKFNDATKNSKKKIDPPKEIKEFDMTGMVREFSKSVRSLMYCALQENHDDEFTTEKEVGRFIGKLCKQKGTEHDYDVFTLFNVVSDCIEESDFLSPTQTEEA